jgi:predicted phosphate transport protein (TIGR00153 family)
MRFNLLDLLLPRETKFYTYLEEEAEQLITGCTMFRELLINLPALSESTIKERLFAINECEQKGDVIERRIIDELHKTFITPIDREDIHLMTINIDKSLDILNSISRKVEIYRVRKVPSNVCKFADIIVEIATELRALLDALRRKAKIDDIVQRMHGLENKADDLFHIGMLFTEQYSPIDVIKYKEVYEHLENIVDSIDYIGKLVRGIMVKLG